MRARIDWKYLLGLDLADPGFDHSLLCEFRDRLRCEGVEERLLDRLLELARARGMLRPRGRQRTDSTHVLAAIRVLNRLELVGETLRAALKAIAVVAPDWMRRAIPRVWVQRYWRRIEDAHLPEAATKHESYAVQVGTDGFTLLDRVDDPGAPEAIRTLPIMATLRRVWARHFERSVESQGGPGGIVGFRTLRGRGSGEDRVESPYDDQARFRAKSGMHGTGYMVHFTESCETDELHLVLHADTKPADVHEARRTQVIHSALVAKDLTPSEHLVDAASVSAPHLTHARDQHGIDLVGPGRRNTSWQGGTADAFTLADFVIDWSARLARCPKGRTSRYWALYKDAAGHPYVRVRFDPADCMTCLSRPQGKRMRRVTP
ncbi:MAG: transposase [Methylobacterium sp.]|nr:transposase [Methylobacterium sp.]